MTTGVLEGAIAALRAAGSAFSALSVFSALAARPRRSTICCALAAAILALALGAARAQGLPSARDLHADARAAEAKGQVIVLMFSIAGCPYCAKVRRSYLGPMAERDARVVVREVEVDRQQRVVDFAGQDTTSSELGARFNVRFVPRVVFLGARGEQLAEPLVGIASEDLYGGVLERRIEDALAERAKRRAAGAR